MNLLNMFKKKTLATVPLDERGSVDATAVAHPEAAPHQDRSHAEILVVVGALMLAMLLSALDQTIVSTALPTIAVDLNGLSKLSWVATAYLLSSAIVTPIYGKLGDLFGRKKIFQISIIIFLIGSALCGLSQNIDQLVFFRALQGIGGGGLMALILAIIGDIVPPRQRGKYQGYFGAVFAVSSVAGPLLGGLFTEHLSWRWIFYINIPLGLIALSAVGAKLHLPAVRLKRKIDYMGAVLLAVAITTILLVSVWGGTQYAWGSGTIMSLIAVAVVFTAAFIVREKHAAEPIIPLGLFRSDIFVVSVLLSLLSGIAMFASILYIPQYQQIVRGNTPTESGLLMLPLVLGLLLASTLSGRYVSKSGHYRKMPIIGTALLTLGIWLFSHLTLTTSHFMLSLWMLIIGAGLGMFMQVATLAVQNSTKREMLGTATSTVIFFRSIGSSLGGAVFGTILTARLTHHIQQVLPNASGVATGVLHTGVSKLPDNLKHQVLGAYVNSFHDMFLLAIPFTVAAFIVSLFLRETPLRNSTREMAQAEGFEGDHHKKHKS
jgi:EmrB/QacA subfamily drug resistance transporter